MNVSLDLLRASLLQSSALDATSSEEIISNRLSNIIANNISSTVSENISEISSGSVFQSNETFRTLLNNIFPLSQQNEIPNEPFPLQELLYIKLPKVSESVDSSFSVSLASSAVASLEETPTSASLANQPITPQLQQQISQANSPMAFKEQVKQQNTVRSSPFIKPEVKKVPYQNNATRDIKSLRAQAQQRSNNNGIIGSLLAFVKDKFGL